MNVELNNIKMDVNTGLVFNIGCPMKNSNAPSRTRKTIPTPTIKASFILISFFITTSPNSIS